MSLRKTLLFGSTFLVLPISQAHSWPAACKIVSPCPTPTSGFVVDPNTHRLEVRNICDLQGMQNNLSASYELKADIDATCSGKLNGGQGFTPIGYEFNGSLEGNGHAINGLSIESPLQNVGLFQFIGTEPGAQIENLALTNVSIVGTSSYSVGALAGFTQDATIQNIYVTGTVVAPQSKWIGGLLGSTGGSNGSLSYVYSGVAVSGGLFGSAAGGIVGADGSVSISNSYSSGSVTAAYIAGGLVGNGTATISNSIATGKILSNGGSGSDVGGLIGLAGDGTKISNSYAMGSVSGGLVSSVDGGFVGAWLGGTNSSIRSSYSVGTVSGGGGLSLGGFVGVDFNPGYITASYWDITSSGTNVGVSNTSADGVKGISTARLQSGQYTPLLSSTTWTGVSGVTFPYLISDTLLQHQPSNYPAWQLAGSFEPPLAQLVSPADIFPPYVDLVFAPGIVTIIPVGQNQFFQYDPSDSQALSQAPTACLGTVYTMLARLIGAIHSEAAVGNSVPGYSNTKSLCNVSDGAASGAYIDCLLNPKGYAFWPSSLASYATFTPSLGGAVSDTPLGTQNPTVSLSECRTRPTLTGDACAETLVAKGFPLRLHGVVPCAQSAPKSLCSVQCPAGTPSGTTCTDHWVLATSVVKALPGDNSAPAGTIIRLAANDPELGQQIFIDMNANDGAGYHLAVLNPSGTGNSSGYMTLAGFSFSFTADGYRYVTLH